MVLYRNKSSGDLFTKETMLYRIKNCFGGKKPISTDEWYLDYDEVEATLKEVLVAEAEALDWTVEFSENGDDRYVEFFQYSPAGEDFSICVFFNCIEDIPRKVTEYYEDFDIDEHIEMWIEAKRNGVSGVPSTRKLVEDAKDIDEMLENLSDALRDAYDAWNDGTGDVE